MSRRAGPVGVLALQGGFEAHERLLRPLGAEVRQVRMPSDLDGLAALVLPGGESTTMMLGIEREGLAAPLAEFAASGRPVLATCAGAIILDDEHLGLIDLHCERNAYGGQIHSFEADLKFDGAGDDPFRGVFIRAPRFTRLGDDVVVLAEHDSAPVAVRERNIFAMSFHPELTADDRIHRRFIEMNLVNNVTDIDRKKAA
ncbi:MAG: pyridoxal 5'-phosphate synthase glutaminase subunit PdxT [Actinobacteria bacterium]|nr:pyridoxal 5'-phosphate synthase glutaminase subunit PdxT [Actinomycetota bacterium]